MLWVSLQKTIRTTAMFLLLLTGGIFSSYLLARLGIPQAVSDFMTNLPLPPWAVMVIINFTLLVLGTFMDAGSMVVIVIPIFLKTILSLGYDPVWFGIVVDIQSEIAAISPPVGFNLFVLKSVVPGVSDNEVANGAMIFVFPDARGDRDPDGLPGDRIVPAARCCSPTNSGVTSTSQRNRRHQRPGMRMEASRQEIESEAARSRSSRRDRARRWSICTALPTSMASRANCCRSIKGWRKDAG